MISFGKTISALFVEQAFPKAPKKLQSPNHTPHVFPFCHVEPFGFAQDRLSETSLTIALLTFGKNDRRFLRKTQDRLFAPLRMTMRRARDDLNIGAWSFFGVW
jgi:hypothetical protein